jgi:hypothetical protein
MFIVFEKMIHLPICEENRKCRRVPAPADHDLPALQHIVPKKYLNVKQGLSTGKISAQHLQNSYQTKSMR